MAKSLVTSIVLAATCLSACAVQQRTAPLMTQTVSHMTRASNANFATTNARLKSAIESRGLIIFATVDHAAGAEKVNQTLAPNTLYIFGNPQAGTPLMLANPALGLDLPLKALVREENGETLITVSDIHAITSAAGVTEPAPVIDKIAQTLAAIQTEAAGN